MVFVIISHEWLAAPHSCIFVFYEPKMLINTALVESVVIHSGV